MDMIQACKFQCEVKRAQKHRMKKKFNFKMGGIKTYLFNAEYNAAGIDKVTIQKREGGWLQVYVQGLDTKHMQKRGSIMGMIVLPLLHWDRRWIEHGHIGKLSR